MTARTFVGHQRGLPLATSEDINLAIDSYAIIHWIEHTYNRRRRQRGLGRLTPVEFELAFTPAAAQAA